MVLEGSLPLRYMPNQALSYTRVIYIGILAPLSSFEGASCKNLVYLMCIAAGGACRKLP